MQKSLKIQIGFTIHKNPTFGEPFFIIFYHMLQLHLNIDVTSTTTTEYLLMYNNTCTHFPVELSIPRKLILYRNGRYGQYIPYQSANRYRYPFCFLPEKIPAVPAVYRLYRRNPAVSANKCIPDRNKKKKKKKKNVLTLSSLHSSASLAVSQTHSAWSFLPQTPDLFDQRFPSLFQIYFLFPLSSFFVLGCVKCMPNSLKFNFFKHPKSWQLANVMYKVKSNFHMSDFFFIFLIIS